MGRATSKAAEILKISAPTPQSRLHEYTEAPRSEVDAVTSDDDGRGDKS